MEGRRVGVDQWAATTNHHFSPLPCPSELSVGPTATTDIQSPIDSGMAKPTLVVMAEEKAVLWRQLCRLVEAMTAGGTDVDAFDDAMSALAAL